MNSERQPRQADEPEQQPKPGQQDSEQGTVERAERLTLHPRVWIGCLAAYNDGTLHGEWVEAAVSDEELVEAARRIVAYSPEPDAEEWAIFDFDEFGGYRVQEYDPLEHVARVARGIAEHGHAFATWAELQDGDESLLDQFEDAFLGEFDSAEDWAREVFDDLNLDRFLRMGAIPEVIRPYLSVDYAAWARAAVLGGDVHIEEAPGGRIYVFALR